MNTVSGPGPRRHAADAIAVVALLTAVLAVVLSMGGSSFAGLPKDGKGEVTVLTVAEGSFTTPGEGGPIELTGASFTQEAGVSILALALVDGDLPPLGGDEDPPCSFGVFVGIPGTGAGGELDVTNGGLHDPSWVEGIPSGGSAVAREIEAIVGPDCDTDGVTIDVTVEVLALR